MNIAIIQGRPVKEPEMKTGRETGKVFCVIRLASDRPYRGKRAQQKTDYFDVIAFGKLGQAMHNNLAKGALCTVLGRIEHDTYIDKYGDRRYTYNIIASNITIHEWLRKRRPLEELDNDFDSELLVPREITNSLFKQIDITDEDVPDDLAGGSDYDSL